MPLTGTPAHVARFGLAAFLGGTVAFALSDPLDRQLRFVLILCELATLAVAGVAGITAMTRARRPAIARLLLVAASAAGVLIALEFGVMFVARSHGSGFALASALWFERHWEPTNSLGYRDREPDLAATRHVLVVGDSFVAGHGIEHAADRFADRLALQLPAGTAVHIVAENGADTREEYLQLVEYPVPPDALVLSYFGNDIDIAAAAAGHRANVAGGIPIPELNPYRDLPRLLANVARKSYAMNLLYWGRSRNDDAGYVEYLVSAYRNPRVMQAHLADLRQFVAFARQRQVPLVVVVFPFLRDLELSRVYTVPIEQFFRAEGVATLSVSDLVAGIPADERVVNLNDQHPSVRVHRAVALALAPMLPDGLTSPASKTESPPQAPRP